MNEDAMTDEEWTRYIQERNVMDGISSPSILKPRKLKRKAAPKAGRKPRFNEKEIKEIISSPFSAREESLFRECSHTLINTIRKGSQVERNRNINPYLSIT